MTSSRRRRGAVEVALVGHPGNAEIGKLGRERLLALIVRSDACGTDESSPDHFQCETVYVARACPCRIPGTPRSVDWPTNLAVPALPQLAQVVVTNEQRQRRIRIPGESEFEVGHRHGHSGPRSNRFRLGAVGDASAPGVRGTWGVSGHDPLAGTEAATGDAPSTRATQY